MNISFWNTPQCWQKNSSWRYFPSVWPKYKRKIQQRVFVVNLNTSLIFHITRVLIYFDIHKFYLSFRVISLALTNHIMRVMELYRLRKNMNVIWIVSQSWCVCILKGCTLLYNWILELLHNTMDWHINSNAKVIKSLRPSGTYMRQWVNLPYLVQILASHLVSCKPLSEPMLGHS